VPGLREGGRILLASRTPSFAKGWAVEKFVRKQNIERYRRLLAENPSEAERQVLERLLAEEEAKEADANTSEA
jgi:hypothetical protein